MPEAPSSRSRSRATELLGQPVEQWIDQHRKSAAKLSYGQLARVLREQHGVEVHPDTVRSWHALLPAAESGSAT